MAKPGNRALSRKVLRLVRSDNFERALSENLHAIEDVARTSKSNLTVVKHPVLWSAGHSHGVHTFAATSKFIPPSGLMLTLPRHIGPDIVIDPGWGFLHKARQLQIPLCQVGLILISHCHIDHIGDLQALLQFLSLRGVKPVLIANRTTIRGSKGQPPVLAKYFRQLCEKIVVVPTRGSGPVRFNGIDISAFTTCHCENPATKGQAAGFIVAFKNYPGWDTAIITDGPLGPAHSIPLNRIRKCRTLVVNIGTMSASPNSDSHDRIFDNALCLSGFETLLKNLGGQKHEIEKIFLSHLGYELQVSACESMNKILKKTDCKIPMDLLILAACALVEDLLGKDVEVEILKEGSKKAI